MKKIRMRVDPGMNVGILSPFWNKMVGSGHALLLTRKDLYDHVQEAVNEIGFQYIRFHGTLSDDVGILQFADESDEEIDDDCLNFTNLDLIYDNLVEGIGIKPFVEFTFMPKYLAIGKTETFRYPSINTPPVNYMLWADLICKVVEHWRDRYGLDEIRQWYFEIWNEPDLSSFWTGTIDDYFKLYDHAARAIKSVDPELRVGGPASSGGRWIAEFLQHCKEKDIPVDFIATHAYGADQPLQGEDLASGNVVTAKVKRVHAEIKASPFPDIEVHITEWGSTTSPFSELHDTSNQAAFICKTILSVNGLVDSFSYWTVSDVFEEQGLPDREFHGGFGLLTLHGIRKPAFLAFLFMNQLGREIIPIEIIPGENVGNDDVGLVATRNDGDDSIHILAWYFVDPKEKNTHEGISLDINVKKEGSLAGLDVDFDVFEISQDHGNAYEGWKQMGSPRTPNVYMIDDLKQYAELERCSHDKEARQDQESVTINVPIEPESVLLIKIFKR